ncbi:MAG: serine/threonine protein kinase, partial [Desulfurococcaceae archaeon]
MVKIALIYKSLLRDDFRVLSAFERAHARREYVTLKILEKLTGFHEEKLLLVLSKLHELGLIKGETISGEKAYRLTYLGYDMLAIRALVN